LNCTECLKKGRWKMPEIPLPGSSFMSLQPNYVLKKDDINSE
jgi:hypothetical protein